MKNFLSLSTDIVRYLFDIDFINTPELTWSFCNRSGHSASNSWLFKIAFESCHRSYRCFPQMPFLLLTTHQVQVLFMQLAGMPLFLSPFNELWLQVTSEALGEVSESLLKQVGSAATGSFMLFLSASNNATKPGTVKAIF